MNNLFKLLIFLICSTIAFSSCTTSKVVTKVTQDSTRVSMKVDTLLVSEMDTVRFDSLLVNFLLLEGQIDSLESLVPETIIQKDLRDRVLANSYRKKYNAQKQLYLGASKDSTYVIEDHLEIVGKDTSYTQPIYFAIKKQGNNISLMFDNKLNILTEEIVIIKTIERKITLFAWLKSQFTLYLLLVIGIILTILKLFR